MNDIFDKKGMADEKAILARLRTVTENNDVWVALTALLQCQLTEETLAMLPPDLSDSAAHYNRGRVAALVDLQNIFRQAREKAQRPD